MMPVCTIDHYFVQSFPKELALQQRYNLIDRAIASCLERKTPCAVFKRRDGTYSVQPITPKALDFFGSRGIMYVARLSNT